MRPLVALRGVAVALLVLAGCAPPADPWEPDEDPDFDGSAPAELRAYSLGDCPRLTVPRAVFPSEDRDWGLEIRVPPRPRGAGLLLLMHGNGDRPERFATEVDAQRIADVHDVIVVLPRADAGGRGFAWPVPPNDPEPMVRLFDDLLACAVETWDVDRTRVFVSGFSSGGLMASFLAMHRASFLAGAVVLSGGTDGEVPFSRRFVVNPYVTPAWPLPVLLAHGGRRDRAFLDFGGMTRRMARKVARDGSVTWECDHGGGHRVPEDAHRWAWTFLDEHRLDGGVSPFADGEDPTGRLPETCAPRRAPRR